MTIDEALLYLERDDASIRFFSPQDYEAFVTLKKYAKSQQQPCEDCISREDVLKVVNSLTEICDSDIVEKITTLNNIDWIKMKINEIPSVTPSRPKGHWILIHPLQEDDDGAYICSNCEHGDWDCDNNYKYCPFCGADMRESEVEE